MNHENKVEDHLSKEFSEVCQRIASLGEIEDAMPKIQELINVFPFYITLIDSTHHILLANNVFTQLLGTDREHIIGQYCPKLVHNLDGPFYGCPLEEAAEKGHSVEREFFEPNSGRWLKTGAYWTGWKTQDDRDIFVHTAFDITETRKANDELERNYEILKVINSLLSLSQQDVRIEDLLRSSLELILSIPWLALESKGGIFLVEDNLDVLVMKTHNGLSESIQKMCAKVPFGKCLCGQAALRKELQFSDCIDARHEITYQGIEPHGHYCVPILYADITLGVLNLYLSEDHHRDKKEEEFLAAFAATLASIIMHRRKEEEMRTQILQIQKMEAIGTLAAGVAHDFNNLLTVIQGYSDMAMLKVDKTDTLYGDLKKIHLSGMRAADLTRQLLLFSRKQPMDLSALDINKAVSNLLKMISRLISEDIVINIDLETNLQTILGDEGRIEQVIMNLTLNARDAMPKGGKINIKTRNVIINEDDYMTIPEARPGKFMCLSIEDTGIGMDKATIQRIFEPFFTTKEAGKGTGLGLSVVYGIVKQHEGWINVYSEPDQGSVFDSAKQVMLFRDCSCK